MNKIYYVLIAALFAAFFFAPLPSLGQDTLRVVEDEEFTIRYDYNFFEGSDTLEVFAFDGSISWLESDGFSLIYVPGKTTFATPFNGWLSLVNEDLLEEGQHRINVASAGVEPIYISSDTALVTLTFIAPSVDSVVTLNSLAFFSINEDPTISGTDVVVVVTPFSNTSTEQPTEYLYSADLYPNPNPTTLNISTGAPELTTVEVFDALGRKVDTIIDASYISSLTVNLSLSDYSVGTYYLVVSNNTTRQVQPFSITR